MLRIFKISILLFIYNSCLSQNSTTSDSSKMTFSVKVNEEKKLSSNDITLTLEFKNVSSSSIKILDVFVPMPVFFSIKIVKNDGSVITPPGGGKIAFSKDSLPLIEILSNRSYIKQFNLGGVLKSYGIVLPEGMYKLNMSYHNQYGKDCIKGWFNSNEISFKVAD